MGPMTTHLPSLSLVQEAAAVAPLMGQMGPQVTPEAHLVEEVA